MILSLLLFLATVSGEPCQTLSSEEMAVVEKTNETRVQNGLDVLVIDCRLMGGARRHARRLATAGAFFHSTGVVENIAKGPTFGSDAVVTWMHSPPHRTNILNRSYRRIGVGAVRGVDGKTYWVQQFSP